MALKVQRRLNILKILEDGLSVFLFGPRGVGKTQWMMELMKQNSHRCLYINLLLQKNYDLYTKKRDTLLLEIEFFLKQESAPIILIDEVQKVPALLDTVHQAIEAWPQVRFILTGSSARKLKRGAANLLAGRAVTTYLHPLSSLETPINLDVALAFGTLPKPYLELKEPKRFLLSYVKTYLQEEILSEALVRNAQKFTRFLEVAAQSNAEPINFSSIARESGVSTHTVIEYFSILEDTLIVKKIPGWHNSLRKQLVEQPRYYFFDCGILNAIKNDLEPKTMVGKNYKFGKLFETWVCNELFRANDYFESHFTFYHWRTKTGTEVDLLLALGLKPIYAIEIKSADQVEISELKGLQAIKEEYPEVIAFVLCQTPRPYEMDDIIILPWFEGIKKIFSDYSKLESNILV